MSEESSRELVRRAVLTGRVGKLVKVGAFVRVSEYCVGLVPRPDLADRLAGPPEDTVQVGDEVTVEVLAINLVKRRILLSLRP